jgi:multiple sugar transport system substrate-binding protein
MRPFQIIVIAIFAVLALGSLFLFATFKGFGGSKSAGVVVIWGTLPGNAMTTVIDDLKRTHHEFEKVAYLERSPDTFDSDLAEAIASGAGPDLIVTTQERLLAERNKIQVVPFSTIPERSFRDMYLPIFDLYLTSAGTYGVPFVVDPLVMYYNRTTLASANVPQAPSTWEAVVGLAPRLTTKSSAGSIQKSAIALGTYDNIPNARAIISLLLLQSGNKISATTASGLRTTLSTGSDSFSQTPGESAISFYTQFADPAKIVYSWNRSRGDARQSFIAGDSALYVGYGSERTLLSQANPNLDFDMAIIPQPQTATNRVDYALAYAFATPNGARNPSGALRTAQALSAKQSVGPAAKGLGMAPALRSELSASGDDAFTPIINASALASSGWLSPAPAATDRIFAAMITSIISGGQNVHDALVATDQALTAALP